MRHLLVILLANCTVLDAKQSSIFTNPDDFHLANFSMGHWLTECEISGLSLSGIAQP